jgi:translation elongation factor P/translation initiation factor 5A
VKTLAASDLRIGMVVLEGDATCRVEGRELLPPTTVRLMVALGLRDLDTGLAVRVVRAADTAVELVALPQRELECLYLTDSGCVLFDPASSEQYDVAQWVGLGLPGGPRPRDRLSAGFWRGRPATLWPASAVGQDAELGP